MCRSAGAVWVGGGYIDITDDVRHLLAENYPLVLQWLDKNTGSSVWDAFSYFLKANLDDFSTGMPFSASEMASSQTIAGLVLQLKAFKNDSEILQHPTAGPTFNIIADEVREIDTGALHRNMAWMDAHNLAIRLQNRCHTNFFRNTVNN